MNVYPAIVTTTDVRLDGVNVQARPGGILHVSNKRGRRIYELHDAEERPLEQGGWLAHGTTNEGPLTILVEQSARPCGCGGPRRSAPTAEHLETLAGWEQTDG